MRVFFIRALLRLTAALSLAGAQHLGAALGWILARVPNETRRVTQINLRACFPGLSEATLRQETRRALSEQGKTFAEAGPLWLWPKERALGLIKQVSGEEHLRAALAQGRGALLAVPHLGNWEIVGLYVSAHYPMTSLYRPPRLPELDTLIRQARERTGARLVPTDAAGLRALYQALQDGRIVGILPDQVPKRNYGLFAPFFGRRAYTMTLLSRLASKSRAPTLVAYAERLPHGAGFHLHILPGTKEICEQPLETSVTALNAALETCVRRIPLQYQWGYKRYKIEAEGDEKLY